ncbi:MAG: Ezrin/radixin/moesin family protein [Cytophagaceae bacterium]
MKKILYPCLALLISMSISSFGQSDEKEWAKRLKAMKPLELKKLVQEKEELNEKLSDSNSKLNQAKLDNQQKDAELARLKKELEDMKSGAATAVPASATPAPATPAKTTASKPTGGQVKDAKGVVYKVQIGAFKNKNLSKYIDNHPNFSGDIDSDGTRKYTLGHFTDYWEADRFKKYLREMGVKDAWIVPYKDGKRVVLKDVLEGAL